MAAILDGSNFTFKYLFHAKFANGETIHQTIEDKSILEPTKSAFYDVRKKAEEIPLVEFALEGEGHTYLVSLEDGHFEVDGIPFECHETLPDDFPERRIIFYRRHTHDFNSPDGSIGAEYESSHKVAYCIGWQTTINGKNYKETLIVK